MKLKNAAGALHQQHSSDVLHPLYTPWGESLDPEHIWEEYPRPQLKRNNYHTLNGYWDYAIIPDPAKGANAAVPEPGVPFCADGRILVPFSPESLLSGVRRQLLPGERLWYQREIHCLQEEAANISSGHRCMLHFGAVDQQAQVYLNGRRLVSHCGGYLPFSADITDYIGKGSCLLQVCVRDDSDTCWHSRGKQTLKRGGMFYTAQSGIWQSVWYEWIPANAVLALTVTPDFDRAAVELTLRSPRPFSRLDIKVGDPESPGCFLPVEVKRIPSSQSAFPHTQTSCDDTLVTLRLTFPPGGTSRPLPFLPWTPDTPTLYPLVITADEDRVESYFAMRCFSIEPDEKGIPRFCLNHRQLFLHGLLDQGYWPDGLMTAPCDEAFLFDIRLAKSYGFNMLRKHIKIEPLRWYYHCDRLGMMVWQDMVSGGTSYHMPLVCYLPTLFPFLGLRVRDRHYRLFSRASAQGRTAWERECMDTIGHLYNVPSLAVWAPFNEGWGQFDAARIALAIKEKDPTRPVDHASGWFDQKGGDFRSVHNYFRPLKTEHDPDRAFVISEYGGYACRIDGHSSVDRVFGYQKYDTPEALTLAYRRLTQERLFPLEEKGLSGAVYTQLSDVEEEVNGLVTYDRRVLKLLSP